MKEQGRKLDKKSKSKAQEENKDESDSDDVSNEDLK
jgi:hypothetical protein